MLKRWKEHTEELYQKDLELDCYDGVVSHPVRHSVQWSQVGLREALLLIKLVDDRIPVELFKTLKDECHQGVALNMSANLKDPAVATGLESFKNTTTSEIVQLGSGNADKGRK